MAAILNRANQDALLEALARLPAVLLLSISRTTEMRSPSCLDRLPDVIDPQEN